MTARRHLAQLQREFDAADTPGPELLKARADVDAARQRYADADKRLREIKRHQRFGVVGRNSTQAQLLSRLCEDYHAEWREARATERMLRARQQTKAKAERTALRPRITLQRRNLANTMQERNTLLTRNADERRRRLLALRDEYLEKHRAATAEAIDAVNNLAEHYTQIGGFTCNPSLPFRQWLRRSEVLIKWRSGATFDTWFWTQVQSIRDRPLASQSSSSQYDDS